MILDFEQIKSITTGVVQFTQKADGIHLRRYTPEQVEVYEDRLMSHLYGKTFNSMGMKLCFRTDSRRLVFGVRVLPVSGTGACRCSFDVFVNGKCIGYMDNFPSDGREVPIAELPMGDMEKEFFLGNGEKEVCIYFPYSPKTVIRKVEIDDGAFIMPNRPKKKLLVFGDSISMGCTTKRPSNHYACRLAEALGAEEYNKAMGTERFVPQLAKAKDDFEPDYITVAYGTNDWDFLTKEQFLKNCPQFMGNLHRSYPNAKIFVITPLWRKDRDEDRPCGSFDELVAYIKKTAEQTPNVVVIDGYDLVPHEEAFFADQRLHPNDEGFAHYTKNLLAQILPHCQ